MKQSQESALLRQVWRKALAEGRVVLPFKDAREARRVRFALYNAVKPVKDGLLVDDELLEAANECKVQFEGEATLVVVRRVMTTELQIIAESLGLVPGSTTELPAPKTAEEAQVATSLERLQEKLKDEGREQGTKRQTPYYER